MIFDQLDFIYANIPTIINLALAIAIPLFILKILSKALYKINDSTTIEKSSLVTLLRIIRYATFIIIFLAVLDVLGINLHSLFVSLGLVSVAISLAAKDTLSNVISGIIILMEKKFQKDDMIEIDGQKGKVMKIGFKSVQLLSNRGIVLIPNVLFSTKSFENFTKNGYYIVPFRITILNKYDLDEKIEQLTTILDNNSLILEEPKYKLFIESITTEGVKLLIKVAINDPQMDSYVVTELIKEFKQKIEFEDL